MIAFAGRLQCYPDSSLRPRTVSRQCQETLTLKSRFNTHKSNCPAKVGGAQFNTFYRKRSRRPIVSTAGSCTGALPIECSSLSERRAASLPPRASCRDMPECPFLDRNQPVVVYTLEFDHAVLGLSACISCPSLGDLPLATVLHQHIDVEQLRIAGFGESAGAHRVVCDG